MSIKLQLLFMEFVVRILYMLAEAMTTGFHNSYNYELALALLKDIDEARIKEHG